MLYTKFYLPLGLVLLLLVPSSLCAFTLHSFDPSFYNGSSPSQVAAMDAALGITGYEIESFDDTTLIPGLTISTQDPSTGTVIHDGTVPSGTLRNDTGRSWGTGNLIYPVVFARDHTFSVQGGTSSLGIGIAEIDDRGTPHVLLVNGVEAFPGVTLEGLPGFSRSTGRNIYIRIDAQEGETIESVTIRTAAGAGESTFFSHVAIAIEDPVNAVPEPSTIILLLFASLAFCWRGWGKMNI